MTQIATQADQESSRIFGRHFEIGIYETYITVIRKVGVLKYDPDSRRIVVRFGPEFSVERSPRLSNERLLVQGALRYLGSFIPLAQSPPPSQPPSSREAVNRKHSYLSATRGADL